MKVLINKIISIKEIKDLIIIEIDYTGGENIFPGQFFMIGPIEFTNKDFILNRPFSVSNFKNNILEFRIRKTGRFTNILSGYNEGDELRLIGPLGSYVKKYEYNKFDEVILLGGGIGVAPMLYYSDWLEKNKIKAKLFYGCASKEFLHYIEDYSGNVIVYTEDGSFGEKGFVTDSLKNFRDDKLIIACGPVQMYKTLKNFKDKFEIKVLLEERMACGFGVCLGCVVETENGYKRVCKEGPIFELEEILFN